MLLRNLDNSRGTCDHPIIKNQKEVVFFQHPQSEKKNEIDTEIAFGEKL